MSLGHNKRKGREAIQAKDSAQTRIQFSYSNYTLDSDVSQHHLL